jgi:hypothetical protein
MKTAIGLIVSDWSCSSANVFANILSLEARNVHRVPPWMLSLWGKGPSLFLHCTLAKWFWIRF